MTVTGNAVFYPINPLLVDVASVYLTFATWFDGIIAFMIFFSLAHWVFSKKYKGKEGKMIAVALGTALTFAFATFEQMSGFRFGGPEMQSVAGIIFMCVLFIFLFVFFKNMFEGASA